MKLSIHQLVGGKEVLAGAGPGAALLAQLVAVRPEVAGPVVMHLDFSGIDVATSSYLRESVLAFRDYCRMGSSEVYPVCANLSSDIEEELKVLLAQRGDALAACDLGPEGLAENARVIGVLEEKQREALQLVINAGAADAPTLARQQGADVKVGTTAWNNRLTALARKSLLVCRPAGRSMQFSPVLRGMSYGP
ncbi:hypothetical protein [Solimonas fluminis]|uniref:hypothetical protein n=1 Tax=Solimonas fluminis TaxID=2086571 RepID=UPI001057375C|nr:hypothetical protein [Solimonas fluminis]